MTVAAMRQDPALPAHFQRDLGLIYRNVELEARLIDDLLDLTRVTQGKLLLHTEVTDLHELLEHTIHMCCAPEVIPKPLVIAYQMDAAKHHALCDPARIQQVFWNLLNNAIKFTPEHGCITIETRNREPNRIEISVADTGIGIEADVIPRLFDAFEQGGMTITRRFGGLGLGLAISKAIAEMHGGTLRVASEGRNRGSVFTLDLMTCAVRTTADLVALPTTPARARGLRILLAEDHEPTRNVLSRLFTRAGHEVRAAGTVGEALQFAESGSFDLLVSDLGLPDASGAELMRQLRARYGLRGIALSGYGMDEDVKASEDAGFALHLTKPVDWSRLEAAVNSLMTAGV
jgi:CheY-like chemotaxis protein